MDTIVNYAIYENGSEYLGTAKVKLPDMKYKTTSVSGTGIAGDVEIPVIGHTDAMSMTIDFIDVTPAAHHLAELRTHTLDLRVAHEQYDATANSLDVVGSKYIVECIPKSLTGGEVSPANPQAGSGEYSCLSFKEFLNGEIVRDVAPMRFRNVDASGTDTLAKVRSILGK